MTDLEYEKLFELTEEMYSNHAGALDCTRDDLTDELLRELLSPSNCAKKASDAVLKLKNIHHANCVLLAKRKLGLDED